MLRPVALCAALTSAFVAAAPAYADPANDHWALDAVNAAKAWKVSRGANVTVAILGSAHPDDGVPELRGKVEKAPDMTGAMFGDEVRSDGGGTGLAALIAGSGRDGGASGVAPDARLLSVPVVAPAMEGGYLDPESETGAPEDSPVARGIRYAANHGASVICVPLSSYGVQRVDRDAVAYALSRGVVLVAAVGDDGQSGYTRQTGTSYWKFPAGYPGVVGVAAVDRQGKKASTSSDNMSVLVSAPGYEVPVTLAGGKHGTMSGTPVATALVAGAAALIKAKYPDLAPELVARALSSTSRPHPPAGYDDKVGFGVVDAAAALGKAGELAGYGRAVPVEDGLHFGKGKVSGAPARPGPDPVRLWIYGIAVALGLGGFAAAAVALSRR
ncbi:type VII secretion-associated serine protease mycosin [Microbispora corallina]|uniref:Type VII secretion-associated serine protease n=1 Tax=Microbispora corallina TaxID=83302 RepID=A0ABQ4G0R2_9ACTN|nr:S8 family serine peptidase [Microbispora corallina]GIH40650.1 type VII secretion-associated serine protease [Microbispora corallina]